MKIPPGMSQTVTHTLIIADRSEAGMATIAEILQSAPAAAERIEPWRTSNDRFLVFVLEMKTGRLGSVAAKDLNQLLSKIDELFDTYLLPPANPSFDIFVEAPDGKTIHDHVNRLLLATAALLEAGIQP